MFADVTCRYNFDWWCVWISNKTHSFFPIWLYHLPRVPRNETSNIFTCAEPRHKITPIPFVAKDNWKQLEALFKMNPIYLHRRKVSNPQCNDIVPNTFVIFIHFLQRMVLQTSMFPFPRVILKICCSNSWKLKHSKQESKTPHNNNPVLGGNRCKKPRLESCSQKIQRYTSLFNFWR